MHEEMSRKEDVEQRWGAKDQDVALKLQELSVDAAGRRWRENHVREYHTVTNHIANSQLRLIRQPSATQPLHALIYLPPHDAAKTFLCEEALRRPEQVTVALVWDHEVGAVTGSGRRGLAAQRRERAASLQWRTSWSAGRPAQLHLSVTCSTRWEHW